MPVTPRPISGCATIPPHADYHDYYTPALRDLVATAFAKDVAAFGYEF